MRRPLALLSAGAAVAGSLACGLTADFSGLQGGGASACDGGCEGNPEDSGRGGGEGGSADASADGPATPGAESGTIDAATDAAACPTRVNSCSIEITKNNFDTSYDGYITYLNAGTGNEVNPIVEFTVPDGVVLFTVGCSGSQGFQEQGVPSSITALSCSQSGTTIIYAFTGTLAAGSQIAIYYTTNLASEAAARCITVAATSCP